MFGPLKLPCRRVFSVAHVNLDTCRKRSIQCSGVRGYANSFIEKAKADNLWEVDKPKVTSGELMFDFTVGHSLMLKQRVLHWHLPQVLSSSVADLREFLKAFCMFRHTPPHPIATVEWPLSFRATGPSTFTTFSC
jgi:hypothetical protein